MTTKKQISTCVMCPCHLLHLLVTRFESHWTLKFFKMLEIILPFEILTGSLPLIISTLRTIAVGRLPGGRPTTFRVHVESCWPFKRPPTPHNRSHLLGWRIYPGPGWKQLQVQMMTFSDCFHSSTVNTPSRNWNRVYKNRISTLH